MSMIDPITRLLPRDPLVGGSLGIGQTGLGGLPPMNGQYPGISTLPYAGPSVGGLMSGSAGAGGLPALGQTGGQNLMPTLRPLSSSTAPMAAEARLASQLGRAASTGGRGLLAPGTGLRTVGGRLLGYGGLGLAGSNIIDTLNPGGQNSNVEQGLQGAAMGAGLGAAAGSVVPVVGTGLGALAGGVVGGAAGVLGNIFGGGGDGGGDAATEAADVLTGILSTAALPPELNAQILDGYAIQMQLAATIEDDAAREQAEAQALQQAAAQALGALAQRDQAAASAQSNAANTLALQAQAQQIFEPLAADIEGSAAIYSDAMAGLRGSLPESYRGIADATVAREVTSASRLADAYRAQAAITPTVNALTQYQQDYNSYAAQMFSQAMGQLAANGYATGGSAGAAGATDINALLQSAGV